tara:strand:+ start:13231 stop:13350 length:120 start_codon:yes stop_codon:yes gene_type:complete
LSLKGSKYVKGEENVLGVELITVLQEDQEIKQKETLEYK